MSRIKILADNVVNQIAAGEVIERPVAVVKELVENSLDAGATQIEVEFRNGGKSYIRVEDDGCGMTPDEALLCLERHATSKISETNDLTQVKSFGFRGEAIPSIASVSRFTLRTRSKDTDKGTEILINAGKIIRSSECGMGVGTSIEVENLFNCVPVRRKFMKTEATEAAHIIHLVRLYAVSYPNVCFILKDYGRTLFKSLITNELEDRLSGIWQRKLIKDLIEVEASGDGMRLYGLMSKPGVGRVTRQDMITLVNGRPVNSKTLNYAIIESYYTHVPKGRYPSVFLYLEIDPARIDVNVHPTKREIRFREEGIVRRFVINAILERLKEFSQNARQSKKNQPFAQVSTEKEMDSSSSASSLIPRINLDQIPSRISPSFAKESQKSFPEKEEGQEAKDKLGDACVIDTSTKTLQETGDTQATQELGSGPDFLDKWRFIGRLGSYYALFETEDGLLVLDCKAANQRVWFDKILNAFSEGVCVSQPLLFPVPIELEPIASTCLMEHLNEIEKCGLVIDRFGRHFYRVSSIPEWLEPTKVEAYVRDLAYTIRERDGLSRGSAVLGEKMGMLAVSKVIGWDKAASNDAVQRLIRELFNCRNPYTCPQGKKTLNEFSYRDLAKKFKGDS